MDSFQRNLVLVILLAVFVAARGYAKLGLPPRKAPGRARTRVLGAKRGIQDR